MPISKHLRLGDFVARDGQQTWPRYTALNPRLLDKLELVIAEVARVNGRDPNVDVRVDVHSGYRTPLHNRGVRWSAKDSRHQYGDAADVFVDNDRDGRMDDLNRDGRVDTRDAQVLIDAAERVERRYPDLVGGAGRYRANSAHGPFAHIDVRGYRARWRNA
jgi:hypothetical protein